MHTQTERGNLYLMPRKPANGSTGTAIRAVVELVRAAHPEALSMERCQ
jgi:hypothetical protein